MNAGQGTDVVWTASGSAALSIWERLPRRSARNWNVCVSETGRHIIRWSGPIPNRIIITFHVILNHACKYYNFIFTWVRKLVSLWEQNAQQNGSIAETEIGGWQKLYNEELSLLYSTADIGLIKLCSTKWAGHVQMETRKMHAHMGQRLRLLYLQGRVKGKVVSAHAMKDGDVEV
jgi:choline dehydrogenase-like flavoprotein